MTQSGSSPDGRQSIGAYEIQGPLGRGGMGEVFLAWDARLRRRVAIKRVRADRQLDTPSRERLLREARAAAGLCHPSIVQVFDLVEDASGDCIVLEYVEGQTLAAELAGGPLEPARAVRLAREIAEGLAAAHEAGIVHRDLKAENVIVTLSGHAKILDFGLARLTLGKEELHLTQDGVLLGTFHMMSPEQANGNEADERSDLFSLGIVLYEMLTGLSPFRGATPSETLKKVLFERPPRVDAVRPGLPARLADLVESLLSKEPAARPDSAAEVAHELEGIATALAAAAAPTWDGSVSSLPTLVEMPRPAGSPPLPRNRPVPASMNGASAVRKIRMRTVAVALLGVALVILGVLTERYFQIGQGQATPGPAVTPVAVAPLRVLVAPPEVNGNDERLNLAASGVLSASLTTLSSLQGIAVIDPIQIVGSPKSPIEMARVAAADEVLVARLDKSGPSASILLRRVNGNDGRLLWHESFETTIDDLRPLAVTVGTRLRRGFSTYPLRPDAQSLEVSDKDYTSFLEIKYRADSGKFPYRPQLDLLERIIKSSPRFLDARLLAVDLDLNLFYSTRDMTYLDRGLEAAIAAKDLAPGNPRPLYGLFKLELASGQTKKAETTLADIERRFPGDPQLLPSGADLKEQKGQLKDALDDRSLAAERDPSWRNLYFLAHLEAQTGHLDEAHHYLAEIFHVSPDNLWALEQSAEIELLFGDLGEAETLYTKLINLASQRTYYTNLGVVQVLRRKPKDALDSFDRALKFEPDNPIVVLDLADAELALGRAEGARQDYQRALRQLENNTPTGGLLPTASLAKAQCLAHLGKKTEAVEIAQQVLKQAGDDPNMLQQAAQVFAVAGDRNDAIECIKRALDKGLQPRWFKLPAFAGLCSDREYQSLVGQCAGGHLLSMTPGDGTTMIPGIRGYAGLGPSEGGLPLPSPVVGGPLESITRKPLPTSVRDPLSI